MPLKIASCYKSHTCNHQASLRIRQHCSPTNISRHARNDPLYTMGFQYTRTHELFFRPPVQNAPTDFSPLLYSIGIWRAFYDPEIDGLYRIRSRIVFIFTAVNCERARAREDDYRCERVTARCASIDRKRWTFSLWETRWGYGRFLSPIFVIPIVSIRTARARETVRYFKCCSSVYTSGVIGI